MVGGDNTHSGWPFWAGTDDDRIDLALALAGLRAGERLVDLGCGDGHVLLRAAQRHGASVVGVELDPVLARAARDLLAGQGVDGTVVVGDFDAVEIDADVVFAYLSPATLQRLRSRLGACPAGTRVVTTGYPVPGWDADEAADRCYLYRIPATGTEIDRQARGWDSGGVLVALRPDTPALVAQKLHHAGGEVGASIAGAGLDQWAAVRTGADTAGAGDEVTVDIRFDPRPEGTVGAGRLEVRGHPPLDVFAVVDDGPPGVWGLSTTGCGVVHRALAGGDIAPVLAAARRSHSTRRQAEIRSPGHADEDGTPRSEPL